ASMRWMLILSASIAIMTTVGIVLSVIFEAIRFFQMVPLTDFLFGLQWSPQVALREDQVGASGAFGIVPLLAGTMLVAFIAMLVAVPIGLMSAIYLAEFAGRHLRTWAKPLLEILAGIPTVVRYQPWRAKRRLVVPSSREAALLTRRAHSARGEAK
ncbi:PstC family ABC transporter permease, partial [Thiolapillus sp.]